MWTKAFWAQTSERAVKTAAQAAVALATADGFNLLAPDWRHWAVVVGMPALISVLTSLASAGVGPAGSPSWVRVWDSGQLRLAERTRGLVTAAQTSTAPPTVQRRADAAADALADVGQLRP